MDQQLNLTPEIARISGCNGCGDIDEETILKLRSLHYLLDKNLIECDAKWTLFATAAHSSFCELLLKPFPPGFGTKETGFNINALLTVIEDTPPLNDVLHNIRNEFFQNLPKDVMDLLYWVLVLAQCPILVLVDNDLEKLILKLDPKMPKPMHAFKIESEEYHFPMSTKFTMCHAIYSAKLEQLFSILSQGFKGYQSSLSDLMDVPILLKTNLKDSFEHSPVCRAWGKSSCGSEITCVALAEYVMDPDLVDFRLTKGKENCVDICVQDGELVRLRYLLMYDGRCPHRKKMAISTKTGSFVHWIRRHKLTISMGLLSWCILTSFAVKNRHGPLFAFLKRLVYVKGCAWLNRFMVESFHCV